MSGKNVKEAIPLLNPRKASFVSMILVYTSFQELSRAFRSSGLPV
jgi:hypothetical protein